MTVDFPDELLPQPDEQYPILALTGVGNLLGYYETVTAALEAALTAGGGPVILYIAS